MKMFLRDSWRELRSPAYWINGILLIASIFIFSVAVYGYIQSDTVSIKLKLIPLVFIIFVLGLAFIGNRLWPQRINIERLWHRLGLCMLLIFSIVSLAWIYSYSSIQESDFGVYYRCGIAHELGGKSIVTACHSNYLDQNDIFWLRSLFYSTPLGFLFGENYPYFKFANVILQILTITFLYFGTKHYLGVKAAFFATLFLALNPEFWFSKTLVTPDHVALLGIVIFTLLIPKALETTKMFFLVVATSLVCFVSGQLRTVTPLVIMSFIVWGGLAYLESKKCKILIYLFMSIFAVWIYSFFLTQFMLNVEPSHVNLLATISSINIQGTKDTYSELLLWFESFWPLIPLEMQFEVASNKVLLEIIYNLGALPTYLFNKIQVLFSGSGYYGFAAYPFPHQNLDTFYTVDNNSIPWNPVIEQLSSFIMFITAFFGLIGIMFTNVKNSFLSINLIWMAVFLMAVAIIGVVQPRYILLAIPAICIFSSLGVLKLVKLITQLNLTNENSLFGNNGAKVALTISSLILLSCLIYLTINHYKNNNRPITLQLSDKAVVYESSHICKNSAAKVVANYKSIGFENLKDGECFYKRIILPSDTTGLYLFAQELSNNVSSYNQNISSYNYSFYLNDSVKLEKESTGVVQWHSIEFGKVVDPKFLTIKILKKNNSMNNRLVFMHMQAIY